MIIETQLLKKYQSKGILVDTNILLLWFVGRVNQKRISRFNRTKKFLPEHYQLLDRLLKFSKVVTTPNILTEVNSLINQMGEPDCSKCLSFLAKEVSKLDEFYLESSTVSQEEKFTKFGLTDSGIISLVQGKYLVLTDDFPLANYLQSIGVDTVNFNYLIDYQWQLKITKIFSQNCQNTVNIAIEKTSDRSPNNKSDRQPKLSINILRENYLQISITTNSRTICTPSSIRR